MQENHELVRLPALNKNSQVYLGVERKPGKVKQSVLFARSVAHDVYLLGDAGRATRSLSRALDQLDRSMLDPRGAGATSSRVFVNVLAADTTTPQQALRDFRATMASLQASFANRLLKLKVATAATIHTGLLRVECRLMRVLTSRSTPLALFCALLTPPAPPSLFTSTITTFFSLSGGRD